MIAILLFISLAGLIAGLIKPSLFVGLFGKNATREMMIQTFGSATVIFVMIAAGVADEAKETPKTSIEKSTVQSTVQPEKQDFTFDVPSLIGKNIDEIRNILGKPIDGDQIEPTKSQLQEMGSDTPWTNTFQKDGNSLFVDYMPKTRKVVGFSVMPENSSSDKKSYMDIGNVSDDDSRYTLNFVPVRKDPSIYASLEIVLDK